MKKLILALFLLPMALACTVPQGLLGKIDGIQLQGAAKTAIGNNKFVELTVSDTGDSMFYGVKNWTVGKWSANETNSTADLVVKTDSCTLEAIDNGTTDALTAYRAGKITVQANSFGSRLRLTIATFVLKVASWF